MLDWKMNPNDYQSALKNRGFHYNESIDRWVGPFNIMLTGFLNHDLRPFADAARAEAIAVVDEQLRARRGTARPQSSGDPGPGLI